MITSNQGRESGTSKDACALLWKVWVCYNTEFTVNLSPSCSIHTVEVIWSAPPTSSLLVLLDLFIGGKNMIFCYIFLFMLFWGLCGVSLFLAPWCSLIWGVFLSRESEEVWHEEDFSWWSNGEAQTQLFQPKAVGKHQEKSSPGKMPFHLPLRYVFHPSSRPVIILM